MNLDELQRKLLATARAHPPADRVPLAFERRIMARLPEKVSVDPWGWWARGLWRAAVSCLAVCVLLGGWTFLSPALSGEGDEFSQQFENTVFAAVDQDDDNAW
jgi:hypothetical protein